MRADDDEYIDPYDFIVPSVGSACTITLYDKPIRVAPRAFPPGFHGAAPGPSEDPPRPRAKAAKP